MHADGLSIILDKLICSYLKDCLSLIKLQIILCIIRFSPVYDAFEHANNSFILLANVNDDNSVNYIAKSTTDKVHAGNIVKDLSVRSLGNGGGSNSFAQGGGKDATIVSKLLLNVKKELKEMK